MALPPFSPIAPAQTHQLTPGADHITGGLGDDIFVAAQAGDLTSADVLDGGGGYNTLDAVLPAHETVAPTLKNIQKIVIHRGELSTLDVRRASGVKELWHDQDVAQVGHAGGPQALTFSGFDPATNIFISGGPTNAPSGSLKTTIVYDGPETDPDIVINLVHTAKSTTLVVAGAPSISIKASGRSYVTLTSELAGLPVWAEALTPSDNLTLHVDGTVAVVTTSGQGVVSVLGAEHETQQQFSLGAQMNFVSVQGSAGDQYLVTNGSANITGGNGNDTFTDVSQGTTPTYFTGGKGKDTFNSVQRPFQIFYNSLQDSPGSARDQVTGEPGYVVIQFNPALGLTKAPQDLCNAIEQAFEANFGDLVATFNLLPPGQVALFSGAGMVFVIANDSTQGYQEDSDLVIEFTDFPTGLDPPMIDRVTIFV